MNIEQDHLSSSRMKHLPPSMPSPSYLYCMRTYTLSFVCAAFSASCSQRFFKRRRVLPCASSARHAFFSSKSLFGEWATCGCWYLCKVADFIKNISNPHYDCRSIDLLLLVWATLYAGFVRLDAFRISRALRMPFLSFAVSIRWRLRFVF
jgi:hypothetical protein